MHVSLQIIGDYYRLPEITSVYDIMQVAGSGTTCEQVFLPFKLHNAKTTYK